MLTRHRSENAKRTDELIEHAVRAKLGKIVDRVEIRFEDDHEGEPAIFVDAVLNGDAPASLGSQFVETQLAIMSALEAEGDKRFPYLATKRPNDEYPEDVFVRTRKRRA